MDGSEPGSDGMGANQSWWYKDMRKSIGTQCWDIAVYCKVTLERIELTVIECDED